MIPFPYMRRTLRLVMMQLHHMLCFQFQKLLASTLNITITDGSIPERSAEHLYNSCCIFGKDGTLKGKHRKLHLFDIDIPGKITFNESKTYTWAASYHC